MPARIERWGLRWLHIAFESYTDQAKRIQLIIYLSPHTGDTPTDDDRSARVAEDYINMVTDCAVPKSMSLDEIREATRADLNQLQRMIHDSRWTMDPLYVVGPTQSQTTYANINMCLQSFQLATVLFYVRLR